MKELPQAPFKALSNDGIPQAELTLVEKDGHIYQHLVVEKIPEEFVLISGKDKETVRNAFENEYIKTTFIDKPQEYILPEDTTNLVYVDFRNASNDQGETFGPKVERIYLTLANQIKLPRNAIALSLSEQKVIILPFQANE